MPIMTRCPSTADEAKGWVTTFFPERVRGTRPVYDLIDAATGEVIAEAGKKVTPARGEKTDR